MDNTRAWRHNLKVVEGFGAPFEELESLAITREFKSLILISSVGGTGSVHLNRVVNYEVDRNERVDLGRISTQAVHGITHSGKIHNRWYTTISVK